jgi:hypothetical protein
MKAWSILVTLILLGAAAVAQEPAHPGQLFSSDLVAWSSMQQPQQPEHGRQQQPMPTLATQPIPNPAPAQPGTQHVGSATPDPECQSAQASRDGRSKGREQNVPPPSAAR